MVHFLNRSQLILWIESNCKHRAICRSLWNGVVELLGGFEQIPPSDSPGWIVKVTSEHNKVWNVAIIRNEINGKLHIAIISEIPWKYYVGSALAGSSLHNGDHVYKSLEMKRQAEEKQNGSS